MTTEFIGQNLLRNAAGQVTAAYLADLNFSKAMITVALATCIGPPITVDHLPPIHRLITFVDVNGIECITASRVVATMQAVRLRPPALDQEEGDAMRPERPLLELFQLTCRYLEYAVATQAIASPRPAFVVPRSLNLSPKTVVYRQTFSSS